MPEKLDREQQLVFGYSPDTELIDGAIGACLLVGIPEAGWDYIRDGKTHTLDLTKIGVPLKLVIFGCKDHKAAMDVIAKHNERFGMKLADARGVDFSIKEKKG